jgi:hypothetical protein
MHQAARRCSECTHMVVERTRKSRVRVRVRVCFATTYVTIRNSLTRHEQLQSLLDGSHTIQLDIKRQAGIRLHGSRSLGALLAHGTFQAARKHRTDQRGIDFGLCHSAGFVATPNLFPAILIAIAWLLGIRITFDIVAKLPAFDFDYATHNKSQSTAVQHYRQHRCIRWKSSS